MPIHPNIARCTHIKLGGHRCGSPALTGENTCHFHTRVKNATKARDGSSAPSIMLLEDAESIQGALMQFIDMVLKDQVEVHKARLVLRAIELASRNVKNLQSAQAKPAAEQALDDRSEEASAKSAATSEGQAREAQASRSSSAIRQAIPAAADHAPGKAVAEPVLRVEVNPKGQAVLRERIETPSGRARMREAVLSNLSLDPKRLP